jgi:cytochrome c oxidase cbb3-type subunit 3
VDYVETAYAIAEGKRLFAAFNCVGCHAHGGGAMGPPLMNAALLSSHEPQDLFVTIMGGTRNGMPAFGGRVPAYEIWQLVAYVRSLSGLARADAAPGRDDDMQIKPPENSVKPPSAADTLHRSAPLSP